MSDQKQKQQYLFKEIIQKNYDPEQFQQFLLKQKQGGQDLDNWSFQQLMVIVNKFQKYQDKDTQDHETKQFRKNQDMNSQQHRKSIIDEFIQSQDYEKSTIKDKKIGVALQIDYENNNQSFNKVISCVQSVQNSIGQAPSIQAHVIKFQKKDGGIFEQSYVSYFINTPILHKTVERRYSDFQWLRSILEMLHPGLPIPPIAKKGQFRRYDDKHLKKRMMILEMFLNKLLQIFELRSDQVLQNFLKLDDKVSFQKFKANYAKSKKMIAFNNIKNSKGNITLSFDPKTSIFLNRSSKYLMNVQPNVKQLYKGFKAAATSLETCGSTLKGIADQCEALNETQRKFRKQNQIPYSANNYYTILNEAVNRLAQQFINQARIFRTETYSALKYESLYMLNLVESFQNLRLFQDKYLQEKIALGKKKLKLFEEGNMEKWQLQKKIDKTKKIEALNQMLPKQTRKLAKLRDVYGLFNNEMHQEIKRYFTTKNLQLANKLSTCCKKQTRMCSEMMMIWVDAQTNIMGLRENKLIKKC